MNLKTTVIKSIVDVYNKYGLSKALEICNNILIETEHGSSDREEKNIIKGELAEASLSCILHEFRKLYCRDSIITKGLFVQDTKTNKVTELDVTLITEYAIYLFECKSYSGIKKEVRDKCSLFRGGKLVTNVFEQNYMHLVLFNHRYGGYVKLKSKPYRAIIYDYATNKFKDTRSDKDRQTMPVLNQDTLLDWIIKDYAKSRSTGKKVDVDKMYQAITINQREYGKALEKEHHRQLNY